MLSIDVGAKKVCVIEGNYHGGNVAVTSCAEIEYENEVVVNGYISDRPALSFLINEIIKTNRMKSRAAVVTINCSDIIAREFTLPNVKLQNLKLIVRNEMYRVIKEDSGFIIDFVVTGMTDDKMLTVTAYAAAKELVESYYSLLKEIKLSPVALDINANTMSKLLSGTCINDEKLENSNYIVADIGFSKISFHGFSGGICRFNRTDVSPVQEFVREMGSINRVDNTRELMLGLDLSPDFEHESTILSDTCKYFTYRLSEEIQRYIQYLVINSESKSVTKIYICGGIANAKGIDAALTESLKIPVEVVSSIGRLSVPKTCSVSKICNAAGALIRL